jgi:hypothetical protein
MKIHDFLNSIPSARPTLFKGQNLEAWMAFLLAQLAAALLLMIILSPVALAQNASPALPSATLTVIPDVAPNFAVRTFVISGVWPNSCVPRSAIAQQSDLAVITIVLQKSQDAICAQVAERFSVSVSLAVFGPSPAAVFSQEGMQIADGVVRVSNSASNTVPVPIITVVPGVDVAGRARTIMITGQTLSGCPFAEPFIDASASQLIGGVAIRLDPVQTLVACSNTSLTSYRFELPYTPGAAGNQRVVAVSSSGLIRSESRIRTVAADGRTRANGDISGLWYDPRTNGSGLQFTHNFSGTDGVFGTWYLYDLDGRARWLSIQSVVWQSSGFAFSADLYETRSAAAFCVPVGCPPGVVVPASAIATTRIGTVKGTFSGIAPYSDTAPQGVVEAFSLSGASLFKSDIVRIGL